MLFFRILGKSILVGIILGVIAAIIAGVMGESSFHMGQAGATTGAYAAGIMFIILFVKNFKAIVFDAKNTKDEFSSSMSERDSEFYAVAEKEVNEENIVQGVWSQALINAKGDENLRKVEYMKLRVQQLKRGTVEEPLSDENTKNDTSSIFRIVLGVVSVVMLIIIVGTSPAWIVIVKAMYNEYALGIEPAGRHTETIAVLKRINNGEGPELGETTIFDAFMVCRKYRGNNRELIELCKLAKEPVAITNNEVACNQYSFESKVISTECAKLPTTELNRFYRCTKAFTDGSLSDIEIARFCASGN